MSIAKTNDVIKYSSNRFVPVFADSENAHLANSEKYGIKIFVQRGLKVYPIELVAEKYAEDVYVVNERLIEQFLIDDCNTYIQDLYTSDLDLDFDQIEVFSALQQLSFTSYGNDTFSTLSLLIDSFAIQKDIISRAVADSALITFSQNLKLSSAQKSELVDLLETKYAVTSMKGIRVLLDRVESNLALLNETPVEQVVTDGNNVEYFHSL